MWNSKLKCGVAGTTIILICSLGMTGCGGQAGDYDDSTPNVDTDTDLKSEITYPYTRYYGRCDDSVHGYIPTTTVSDTDGVIDGGELTLSHRYVDVPEFGYRSLEKYSFTWHLATLSFDIMLTDEAEADVVVQYGKVAECKVWEIWLQPGVAGYREERMGIQYEDLITAKANASEWTTVSATTFDGMDSAIMLRLPGKESFYIRNIVVTDVEGRVVELPPSGEMVER